MLCVLDHRLVISVKALIKETFSEGGISTSVPMPKGEPPDFTVEHENVRIFHQQ